MTKELFDKAVAEGNPVCYYLFKDLGIDKDCKYFVETGTFEGYSVQVALDHGYEQVFSNEIFENRYTKCLERFKDNDNVNLWLGDSYDTFPDMMKRIDKKSCFWLDAHSGKESYARGGTDVPLIQELEHIKNHHIKDHIIAIDDAHLFGKKQFNKQGELVCDYSHVSYDTVKDKILEINSNYDVGIYRPYGMDMLIAFVS